MRTSAPLLAFLLLLFGVSAASAQSAGPPLHPYAFRIAVDQVLLKWDAPSGAAPSSYNIYRTGKKVGSAHENSFTDTGLNMGEAYAYSISAVDAAGTESPRSEMADVVMPFTGGKYPSTGDAVCVPSISSSERNVSAIESLLPSLLADADKYEALATPLRSSTDRNVVTSINFLEMGVRMLRSVPIALTCDPKAFAWAMPPRIAAVHSSRASFLLRPCAARYRSLQRRPQRSRSCPLPHRRLHRFL